MRRDYRIDRRAAGNGLSVASTFTGGPVSLYDWEARESQYRAAIGDGPLGNDSTITLACCVRVYGIEDQHNQQRIWINGSRGSLRGFYMEVLSGLCHFRVNVGPPDLVASSPPYVFVNGDVGKDILFTGTYDGGFVRLYRQGVQVGFGTPATGYVAPTSPDRPQVGQENGGDWCYDIGIIGVAASDTTIVNPVTHYNACVAANNLVGFTGCTNLWQGSGSSYGGNPWPDAVGSSDFAYNSPLGPAAELIELNWAS